ncbi:MULTISPECIES: SDR family NAD(P)-dependent oxidoreductase [unclassified Meiothermus]|uniref:SDR family NAD(P)-dependent oxidoreductase n=1 Tax=unclassified Meiothermus TaxID=370471 RepID=UPI000D7CE83F|nr:MULTISPECIES: SDR family NAD(P)-dependent oxidoreductase [unclassified Meiothermus]PZA05805.1 short-chain dehydrogenase [Meiothermus sp. Pnk-1]RYM27503.1 SDR family NAD(P)-dependent oxidoreductase [Meiothermus sp. PNK-Is4]
MKTLIIGATGGIGGALARLLQGRAELWLAGRRAEALAALAAETGGRAAPLELGDELEVAALFEATGPLDLLLYAAGAVARSPLRATPRDRLEEVLTANFLGAFFALKHARFHPGARALFLGAYPAYVEAPGFAAYAAGKRALEGLVNAARKELGREGVKLILVRLPAVATELWAPLGGAPRGALTPDEAARRILAGLEGAGETLEL